METPVISGSKNGLPIHYILPQRFGKVGKPVAPLVNYATKPGKLKLLPNSNPAKGGALKA